jgi:tetratricopeptide (TPR) repeat protein
MLADVLHGRQEMDEAERLYLRVLKNWECVPAIQTGNIISARRHLALIATRRGDVVQARAQLEQAITVLERSRGSDHLDLATLLTDLAVLHLRTSDLVSADTTLQRALGLLERKLGTDHERLLPVLDCQVACLGSQNRWADALAVSERGLRLLARHGGTDTRDYVLALHRHVGLCVEARNLPCACTRNQELIVIIERMLGPADANLAAALRNGAALARQTGDQATAAALDKRADSIQALAQAPIGDAAKSTR